MIEFLCSTCGATLRVDDEAAGTAIRCGGCMTTLRVPQSHPDPLPSRETDQERDPERDFDEERPRRRRRLRQPPPPPGRGPVFWVLMAFGLCIAGCCICCGGGYLLLPGEQWRTHRSTAGGFTVDLPAEPRQNFRIPGMKPDPNLKVEGTIYWKRGEIYAVMYLDVPPDRGRGKEDEDLLDKAIEEMEQSTEVRRVVRKESITVSGFPGREIEFLATDGGTYISRIVLTDRRMYSIVGGGRFVGPGNANIRRFLNSFAVTNAKRR